MKAAGGCLCGAVRYEIDGEPIYQGHCHCRDCQRATGTGHVSIIGLPAAALKITGQTKGFTSSGLSGQPITRNFCPNCGSQTHSQAAANPGMVNVTAGTLDDTSVFQPQASIFVKDRPSWDRLEPGLMEFEIMPPPASS